MVVVQGAWLHPAGPGTVRESGKHSDASGFGSLRRAWSFIVLTFISSGMHVALATDPHFRGLGARLATPALQAHDVAP